MGILVYAMQVFVEQQQHISQTQRRCLAFLVNKIICNAQLLFYNIKPIILWEGAGSIKGFI